MSRHRSLSRLAVLAATVVTSLTVAGPLAQATTTSASWLQLGAATALGPSPRSGSAMAYDAATHTVVLFGGIGANGTLGDTWTWNASAWTQQASASPSPRYGASLAYDNTLGDLVLFGGTNDVTNLDDTWLWNGTYWSAATSSTSPVSRSAASMAYDADAHALVLFGGTNGVSSFDDTWSLVTTASAPHNVRATSNADASSVVTWNAPVSDGGSAISGYAVAAMDKTTNVAAPTCDAVATMMCTFTGLTNGDHYVFSVNATTVAGAGASASSNVAIPAVVPGAPTITAVTTSHGAVTLSWSAPQSTGGIPIVSYRAMARPGGAFCHVAATARDCRILGLRDGARYTFRVVATNAAGDGTPSAPSARIIVRAAPGPPLITLARSLHGRVLLRWRWPSANGGSRVTGYNVYVGPVSGSEATSPLNARIIRGRQFSFRGRKGYRTYIEVRAVNAVGAGAPSREVMVFTS